MTLTKFLIYLFIASFCLGQFGNLPFFGTEINIYLWDILAGFLVFYWLMTKLVEGRLELPPLTLPIFCFTFLALISLINGGRWIGVGEWVVAAGYWVRWVVYAGVYFVVSDSAKKIPNIKYQIPDALVFSGIVLAILGFIQLAIFPDLSDLDPSLGWDPHQGRMVATWFDPNFLGAYFVLCLSLLTGKLFSLKPNTNSLMIFTSYLLLVIALILTLSRSAWGMMALVWGIFALLRSRKFFLLMIAIAFSAYFFVPRAQTRIAGITDPADSASLRLISWQRSFEVIRLHPFLGVGFNAFRYAQKRAGFFRDLRGVSRPSGHAGAGSDSSLLLVLATTGIPGFFSYLCLYGLMARRAWSEWKKRKVGVSLGFLAALTGLFAESFFVNSLFYPPILVWVWIVSGLFTGYGSD